MAGRIYWLDMSRGLAIMFLIVIHYIAAFEARGFISLESLHLVKAFFRVATPFFIFVFGFTFFIAYKKRYLNDGLSALYSRALLNKLLYIVLAREVIAMILAVRFPSLLEKLPQVLTFQSFSYGGEILIFYFFAIIVAPLNLKFLLSTRIKVYGAVWLMIYSLSFFIGAGFVSEESHGVLRFLFYDVYAFLPFLLVMATGMLMAHLYQRLASHQACFKFFIITSLSLILFGACGFYMLNVQVIENLAVGTYKSPPNLFYITFYIGLTLLVLLFLAYLEWRQWLPTAINKCLSLIGRYSLVAYVLHYTFFLATYIPKWLGKPAIWEFSVMVAILLLSYGYLCGWDKFKKSKFSS